MPQGTHDVFDWGRTIGPSISTLSYKFCDIFGTDALTCGQNEIAIWIANVTGWCIMHAHTQLAKGVIFNYFR